MKSMSFFQFSLGRGHEVSHEALSVTKTDGLLGSVQALDENDEWELEGGGSGREHTSIVVGLPVDTCPRWLSH